ncbi:hypothetical protein LEMLEM_LOCUS7771, partial [Lemmus lemmus]
APSGLARDRGQPELEAGRGTACLIPAPAVRECEGCPSVLRRVEILSIIFEECVQFSIPCTYLVSLAVMHRGKLLQD